ncbi:hypothetical protein D3C76_1196690 [compost metagenome]
MNIIAPDEARTFSNQAAAEIDSAKFRVRQQVVAMHLPGRDPQRTLRWDHPAIPFSFDQHHAFDCKQQLALNMVMRGILLASSVTCGKRRPANRLIVPWRFIYRVWHFRFRPCIYDEWPTLQGASANAHTFYRT